MRLKFYGFRKDLKMEEIVYLLNIFFRCFVRVLIKRSLKFFVSEIKELNVIEFVLKWICWDRKVKGIVVDFDKKENVKVGEDIVVMDKVDMNIIEKDMEKVN